jgi:radical SAM superfamily enzyme YgiQ (UPF0313 family)
MCYTNILQILDLAQIPLRTKNRTWEHPIVIGGGPCVYNPEPIADFFDIFYIGEGETRYRELLDLYKEFGTDSYIGKIASISMSCTETIFYTMSVYCLTAKVTKTRHILPAALMATLAGLVASVLLAGDGVFLEFLRPEMK